MLSARGGLIFKALCVYLKVRPLPSLGYAYCWKGGLIGYSMGQREVLKHFQSRFRQVQQICIKHKIVSNVWLYASFKEFVLIQRIKFPQPTWQLQGLRTTTYVLVYFLLCILFLTWLVVVYCMSLVRRVLSINHPIFVTVYWTLTWLIFGHSVA